MRYQPAPKLAKSFALVLVAVCCMNCAAVMEELESAVRGMDDQSTPADGLREALKVGTGRAVERRGQAGGYLGDALAEIAIPRKLASAARALELTGRGNLVEEFKVSLNRAAEAAAPVARDVFVDSIRQMTFDDAMTILKGNDSEATDFFRRTAGVELARRFSPIVDDSLAQVGATQRFDGLMDRIEALPLVDKPVFDLTEYVTDEALDGLFDTIADEERKIRTDPVARTTDLLRRWFGGDRN
ncbi:MAG: DUF4197 domain-containing protein [Acidobacteriota bacterium]|nr:DUF4197 domain-containing protein [Acidobacteriota bacterium]